MLIWNLIVIFVSINLLKSVSQRSRKTNCHEKVKWTLKHMNSIIFMISKQYLNLYVAFECLEMKTIIIEKPIVTSIYYWGARSVSYMIERHVVTHKIGSTCIHRMNWKPMKIIIYWLWTRNFKIWTYYFQYILEV